MSELFKKVLSTLSKDQYYDSIKNEWIILCKEHKVIDCICGHKVKQSSTIYNKYTRTSLDVGTICCKKYCITRLCENQIFIRSMKKYRDSFHNENIIFMKDNTQFEKLIISQIEEEYNRIFEKLEVENEYYRIVPLNRLLTDLFDLQNNYDLYLLIFHSPK